MSLRGVRWVSASERYVMVTAFRRDPELSPGVATCRLRLFASFLAYLLVPSQVYHMKFFCCAFFL